MEKDAETMLEMHRQIGSLQQTINNLRQNTDSKDARIAELEKQLAAVTAERDAERKRLRRFPIMIRKMWSGTEVQQWIEAALQEGSDSE